VEPSVEHGSDLAFAWSNALRYVQGQRDVLRWAGEASLQLYRSEIAMAVESVEAVPGSNSICCAEAVGPDATLQSFPLCDCITIADARGGAKEAGQGFQHAIQKIEDSVDDETATLLFILASAAAPPVETVVETAGPSPAGGAGAAAASGQLRWQSLWSTLPQPPTLDGGDPMVAELQEIHSALFPALTNAFPRVFPAESFTVEKLASAAKWYDERAVAVLMGDGAVLTVLLPLECPLGQGIAPTCYATTDGTMVRLVSTVSLAMGTELACGHVGPWPVPV
jgi:hypothetical protein